MVDRRQKLPLVLCTVALATARTLAADAPLPHEANEADFGRHLQRTIALLATSEQTSKPVRVLFYGQSIIAQGRVQSTLLKSLRLKYPKANILPTSNAIGGYEAPVLVRTMVHDVVSFRPDLIVFDDYGGETDGNFERIIAYLRSQTTAEVLMWSPHIDNFNAAMDKQRDATAEFRRSIAEKYGCEFADIRGVWKQYLDETKTPKTALLRDQIHNTDAGCELMGNILARHFVPFAGQSPADNSVRSISLADEGAWKAAGLKIAGQWKKTGDGKGIELAPGASLQLPFTGVRVDLNGPVEANTAAAKIMVDDQVPSTLREVWTASRPSTAPIGWFPALNHVDLRSGPFEREAWTLHFFNVSPDGSAYQYRLTGSKSGADGEGKSTADFVSPSGKFGFSVADITIAKSAKYTKKPLPAEFDVTWKTFPMAMDEYRRKPADGPNGGAFQTLVNGLSNQTHTLNITAEDGGPIVIEQLIVHEPALHAASKE